MLIGCRCLKRSHYDALANCMTELMRITLEPLLASVDVADVACAALSLPFVALLLTPLLESPSFI